MLVGLRSFFFNLFLVFTCLFCVRVRTFVHQITKKPGGVKHAKNMAFFLRYTDKVEIDMERKTSVHLCNPDDADEFVEGLGHVQILNGLCGFPIEADNEEDAVEEAIESVIYRRERFDANSSGEEYGRHAFLFEGKYSGDCIDGDLFLPSRVVENITQKTT